MDYRDENRWIKKYFAADDVSKHCSALSIHKDVYFEINDAESNTEQERLRDQMLGWRNRIGLGGPLADHLHRHAIYTACTVQNARVCKLMDDVITGRSEMVIEPKRLGKLSAQKK